MASTRVNVGAGRATSPAIWWLRWLWTVLQGDSSYSSGVIYLQMLSLRAQVCPSSTSYHPISKPTHSE